MPPLGKTAAEVMFTAIITAMVLVFWATAVGIIDFDRIALNETMRVPAGSTVRSSSLIRRKAVLKRYAPLLRGGRARLPCLDQRVLGPDGPDIRIGFIVFHFGKLEKVVHYFDYMICVLENNFEA